MDQERRQFYRIDQPVVIDFKVVSREEVADSSRPYQFNVSPYFLLQSQLAEIDSESQHLIYKIGESTPHLATYLQQLNKKLDLIASTIAGSDLNLEASQPQTINLSEGGLSFATHEPIPLESYLALKLVFPDNGLGLLLYAEVQRCSAIDEGYELGVSFMKMPESCRTLLARLILEAQAKERQRHSE
ncbi:PilZ domain-containing protein [Marinobacterium lutimaris]|uniref:PilZ domain-containing protein n=1 Tax=Marinobacterium lutimaris TaxID=568106 RepID=A0A1H5WJI4_9GAMM|nr:PilZ domain-containing protein [Marinobacterium lutimaris]SEF99057.1 PilZ domain-containing protein [Marinobacterium lutimaris]